MSKSKIQWTERTWNPLAGCTRASEGCDNCYAAVMSHRLEAMALADIANGKSPGKKAKYIGTTSKAKNGHIAFNGKINLDYDAINEPHTWKKPVMVFVNSMSDLFHKDVRFEFIVKVFQVMVDTPQHTYQVLTKRPERMKGLVNLIFPSESVPSHIWLGTSVENQEQANIRIPHLLATNAKIKFLSCEPLLGEINLNSSLGGTRWIGGQRGCRGTHKGIGTDDCPKYLHHHHDDRCKKGINWLICGGESGHNARPMNTNWARSLRDQCISASVPFYFKQFGEYIDIDSAIAIGLTNSYDGKYSPYTYISSTSLPYLKVGKSKSGHVLDGKTWQEFPVIGGDE